MKERRYVVVNNIPGDFLHTYMDQDIRMLLDSTIAKLIIKLESKLDAIHMEKYKWQTDSICNIKKHSIWQDTGGIAIQEAIIRRLKWMWFHKYKQENV